jgi:hypothetical protein
MVRSAATPRVSNHEARWMSDDSDLAQPEILWRDSTIISQSFAYGFLREKNAWKAATASLERIRSPNKWPS